MNGRRCRACVLSGSLLYYEEPRPFYDFYVCNTVVKRTPIPDPVGFPFRFKEVKEATASILGAMDQYVILAGVSPRMHIFYRDAYAVLAQKHDASKLSKAHNTD